LLYGDARKARKQNKWGTKRSRDSENSTPASTVSQYLEDFKILKAPKGYTLVNI